MVFILVRIKKKSPATPSQGSGGSTPVQQPAFIPLPSTSGAHQPSKSPSPVPSTSKGPKASTARESGMPTAVERRKAAAAARKKKLLVILLQLNGI